MLRILALLSVCCLFVLPFASAQEWIGKRGKLIAASVLFRHGDRTPVVTYPTDPYQGTEFWEDDWGQLTKRGKQRHFNLGIWLKARYSSILSKKYDEKELKVWSTEFDRTIESALSNVAGMYPPSPEEKFISNLPWQPIPVRSTPAEHDILLGWADCPAYAQDSEAFIKSRRIVEMTAAAKPLFEYISLHTGLNVTSITDAGLIYDNLYINSKYYNRALPKWAVGIMKDGRLKEFMTVVIHMFSYTPLMRRVRSGFLLKRWLDSARDKVQLSQPLVPAVCLYSAHDATVASMLYSLNLFSEEKENPPYAATVLFETVEYNSEHYVEVYYKTSELVQSLRPIWIPNCGYSCPLNRMYELYTDVLPTKTFQEECKARLA